MLYFGTDPESYITVYTLVYEDYTMYPKIISALVQGVARGTIWFDDRILLPGDPLRRY